LWKKAVAVDLIIVPFGLLVTLQTFLGTEYFITLIAIGMAGYIMFLVSTGRKEATVAEFAVAVSFLSLVLAEGTFVVESTTALTSHHLNSRRECFVR
jgi:hypothetical protein